MEEFKKNLLIVLENAIRYNSLENIEEYFKCAKEESFVLDADFFNQNYWQLSDGINQPTVSMLGLAAFYGHKKTTQYLIENFDLDINIQSSAGDTPLHLCITGFYSNKDHLSLHEEVLSFLLDHKAKLNIQNSNNQTPKQLYSSMNKPQVKNYQISDWLNDFFDKKDDWFNTKRIRMANLLEMASMTSLQGTCQHNLAQSLPALATLKKSYLKHKTALNNEENNKKSAKENKTPSPNRHNLQTSAMCFSLASALLSSICQIYNPNASLNTHLGITCLSVVSFLKFNHEELQIEKKSSAFFEQACYTLFYEDTTPIKDQVVNHVPFQAPST